MGLINISGHENPQGAGKWASDPGIPQMCSTYALPSYPPVPHLHHCTIGCRARSLPPSSPHCPSRPKRPAWQIPIPEAPLRTLEWREWRKDIVNTPHGYAHSNTAPNGETCEARRWPLRWHRSCCRRITPEKEKALASQTSGSASVAPQHALYNTLVPGQLERSKWRLRCA
jgi:hypothetical protein